MASLLHLEAASRLIRSCSHNTGNYQNRCTTRCRQTQAYHPLGLGCEKERDRIIHGTFDRISSDRSTTAKRAGQNTQGVRGTIRGSSTQQVIAGTFSELAKVELLFNLIGRFIGLAKVFGIRERQQ